MCCGSQRVLIQTLEELGWSINYGKSQLQLKDQCTFVGFNVHSNGDKGPWLQVLPEKIKRLKSYLRNALCNNSIHREAFGTYYRAMRCYDKSSSSGKTIVKECIPMFI